MNCQKRLWWKLFRRCGSDYFAGSSAVQTAPDGRVNYLTSAPGFPFVMHLSCLSCGAQYVFPDRARAKELIPLGDPRGKAFLDEDRQQFDKSFDPRQKLLEEASLDKSQILEMNR